MSKGHKKINILFIVPLLMLFLLIPNYAMVHTTGEPVEGDISRPIKVVDAHTGKPIEGAFITSGNEVSQTDKDGMAYILTETSKVAVRAHGYLRTEETIAVSKEAENPKPFSPIALYASLRDKVTGRAEKMTIPPLEIRLDLFTPKALYLSFFGIGDKTLRESALNLIRETELNALVIDVKGDSGTIPYKSAIPLASEVGALKVTTVKDMAGLIKSLKESGVYTIARIVVFKDNLLALKMPNLAVKSRSGEIWRDREGLAWVDPFKQEVWDYNTAIALEAAQYGFDEIQLDYVRFPDASAPQFSMPNTKENRINAVSGFLRGAKKKLLPYNVFLSADIFGYVCWNLNDTNIGQTLEDIAPHIDYLCPMLYPSGFQYGIPGYRIPVEDPYEVIYLTLRRAQERTNLPSVRFRPWLQAFRDYAFDKRPFEKKEIREQLNAVETFGSHGWMLWNSRNVYSGDGFRSNEPVKPAFGKLQVAESAAFRHQAYLQKLTEAQSISIE